jgi:hypothetical protein
MPTTSVADPDPYVLGLPDTNPTPDLYPYQNVTHSLAI